MNETSGGLRRSKRAAAIEENEDHGRASEGDQRKGAEIGNQVEIDAHEKMALSLCGFQHSLRSLVTTKAMNSRGERWQCIQQCGACCHLSPEERPEALAALSEQQRLQYLAMVGDDGWCIHYDSGGRRCRIYTDRPDFCRVSQLGELFKIEPDSLDVFAIQCCRQQIRSRYGGRSREMRRFNRAQRAHS